MDKTVIFAVAGSGKTTHIINQLTLEKKALIITYTNSNYDNLRRKIIEKWGYFPITIKLVNYFSFLYSFCYRPFLASKYNTKGINWKPNTNLFAVGQRRYIDSFSRLYSNRIAKFIVENNILQDIIARFSKYFDVLYIDEVQDFAGHDFNFLRDISQTSIDMLFVGDFYQHTFDTSRDGKVNKSLHDDYRKYMATFQAAGFVIDSATLLKSYRCSPTICQFITDKIGIEIQSHRADATLITLVNDKVDAQRILEDNQIVKLFYQEHYKYGCFSKNWGDCKGEDHYNDVCVILNKTVLESYNAGRLKNLVPQTRNKFYVACSRAKQNLYFIPHTLLTSIRH
jgi:DNA helicase-2/ATP-dependent DNA helicase PcrA